VSHHFIEMGVRWKEKSRKVRNLDVDVGAECVGAAVGVGAGAGLC
jgi:hypothetical protein